MLVTFCKLDYILAGKKVSKTMEGVLPDAVDLKISPAKRKKGGVQLFKMMYRETFIKPPKELKENTERVAKALVGNTSGISVRVFYEKKNVVFLLEATLPLVMVGDVLFSEFLVWGTLGNTSLKELYTSLIVSRAQTAELTQRISALPLAPPPVLPSLRRK